MATTVCYHLMRAFFQDDIEKTTDGIQHLAKLYPRVRFHLRKDVGLIVFVREGEYKKLCCAIAYSAAYIEEVKDNGTGFIHKNRNGLQGPIRESTETQFLMSRGAKFDSPTPISRTWYEWLDCKDGL